MKSSKLIDIFKNGSIVIPMYLFKNYENLKLDLNEFVFLMYLNNCGDGVVFNPQKIESDLGYDLGKTMGLVDSLTEKGFISVDVSKNEKGYMEDTISLDGFFSKLKLLVVDDVNNNTEDTKDSTIFELIESEFGRTLSSMEYEIIKAWLENNISEELIREAVKEAVFNGVSNLKYIDKILYEWGKKGIKTASDVEESIKKRNIAKDKEKNKDNDIDLDIMDWDWFEDE